MKCIHWRLIGYHPRQHTFVIDIAYDEGGQVLLVNGHSGKEFELEASPHFSPTGARLVSVNSSEMGEHTYDIKILSNSEPSYNVEFQYSAPTDSYELWHFVSWDGDHRIRLRTQVNDRVGGSKMYDSEVVAASDKWQLRRPWLSVER